MDSLDKFFSKNQENFDVFEPKIGHQNRFKQKLKQRNISGHKTKKYFYWAAAAMLVISMSLVVIRYNTIRKQQQKMAEVSPKIKQSTDYFAMIIKDELKEIKQIETPETQNIVAETMHQMAILEKDYDKLLKDFKHNNDNKLIINAMIENFRKRIDLLQYTKQQLEEIKNFKHQNYEHGKI